MMLYDTFSKKRIGSPVCHLDLVLVANLPWLLFERSQGTWLMSGTGSNRVIYSLFTIKLR